MDIWLCFDIFSALFLLMAGNRVKKVVANTFPEHIGAAIENMLKTGCLATRSGLDLQQVQK